MSATQTVRAVNYRIWKGDITSGPTWFASDFDSPTFKSDLSYDPTLWQLVSAVLTINGINYQDLSLQLNASQLMMLLNDGADPDVTLTWALGAQAVETVSADIAPLLFNGSNSFQFHFNYPDGIISPFGSSKVCGVDASLTLTWSYIGGDTTVPPPPKPPPPSSGMPDYTVPLIVGAGVLAGVVVGVVLIRRKRRNGR